MKNPYWVYRRYRGELHVVGTYVLRRNADRVARLLADKHERKYCVLDCVCDTVCSVWGKDA